MKTSLSILVFFFLLLMPVCMADFIYNVDFEDPPHDVDQPVVTGSGSDAPSSTIGDVFTRDSLGDFSTQVASLEGGGGMAFFSASPSATDIVLISWDIAVLSLGSVSPGGAFVSISSSPSVGIGWAMNFNQDLTIDVGGTDIGTFTLGEQDHFQYTFDLDNDVYTLLMNGSPVLSDQSLDPSFDIQNVGFNRDFLADPRYAVDNFQWQIIPEPSTCFLMLLGVLTLCHSRSRIFG